MKTTHQAIYYSAINHLTVRGVIEDVLSISIIEGITDQPGELPLKPWYQLYIQYKQLPKQEDMVSMSKFFNWYFGKLHDGTDVHMDTESGPNFDKLPGYLPEAKGFSISEFYITD